jgi:2-amino-4-hydroxy-6-hydroxymethyldihydropteridine diphosphokinase
LRNTPDTHPAVKSPLNRRGPRIDRLEEHMAKTSEANKSNGMRGADAEPVSRHIVYLGLGSNLGDRAAHLRAALAALAALVRITHVSAVYETAALYLTEQPDFYNLACAGETTLGAVELLRAVKRLEGELGRTPGVRYGPRVIDIDLLFYDDLILQTSELGLPHPRLTERAFVLMPLAEIAPRLRHPVSGCEVTALAASMAQSGVHRIGPLFGLAGYSIMAPTHGRHDPDDPQR